MVERICGQLPHEALAKLIAKRLPKPRKRTAIKTVQNVKSTAEGAQKQENLAAEWTSKALFKIHVSSAQF
jgi:hypothetical protein